MPCKAAPLRGESRHILFYCARFLDRRILSLPAGRAEKIPRRRGEVFPQRLIGCQTKSVLSLRIFVSSYLFFLRSKLSAPLVAYGFRVRYNRQSLSKSS